MPTLLLTGANRGIGLEFARQYAADGWAVIATCRDPGRAKALGEVKGTVEIERLDVADAGQIESLASRLGSRPIDLLINNAAIAGRRSASLGALDVAEWMEVLRTNVVAPVKVAERLAGNVAAAESGRIVTITSRLGSIAENSGGYYSYRSSKAAVNQVMRCLAVDLRRRRITVVVMNPGWVRTDMGGRGAPLSAADSVAGMRRVIAGLKPSDTGGFFSYDGKQIPW